MHPSSASLPWRFWRQRLPNICIYQTALYYKPGDGNLNFQHIEKLKYQKFISRCYPIGGAFSYVSKAEIQCIKWFNGRKNAPIWEANKFKPKEDTEMIFLFLESTQNAVLHQCVLIKTSLKWRLWILINNVASLGSCPWPWESFQL